MYSSRPLIYLHLRFCVFRCWALLTKLTLPCRFSSTARICAESHEIQEISDDCQLAAPKFFIILLHHTKVFVNEEGRENTQRRLVHPQNSRPGPSYLSARSHLIQRPSGGRNGLPQIFAACHKDTSQRLSNSSSAIIVPISSGSMTPTSISCSTTTILPRPA